MKGSRAAIVSLPEETPSGETPHGSPLCASELGKRLQGGSDAKVMRPAPISRLPALARSLRTWRALFRRPDPDDELSPAHESETPPVPALRCLRCPALRASVAWLVRGEPRILKTHVRESSRR